jgi:hypothetical protein
VNYKALTGLSLLQIPHFHARHGASLKVIHSDTASVQGQGRSQVDKDFLPHNIK